MIGYVGGLIDVWLGYDGWYLMDIMIFDWCYD